MNRRVLIVSPRFPPTNAADMHRVRQSLPYLAENGWEPTVLAIEPEQCEMPLDPWLCKTVPPSTRIVETSAVPARLTRRIGLGNFDLRALPYVARAGSRLLARERFDLVFFSTTAFSLMCLGPYWQTRFGVPYALDLQDPWRSDYYRRTGTPPPGGRLKHGVSQGLARVLEPPTIRHAAHVISVSPAYPPMLVERYPELRADRFTILPFGAPQADVDLLRREPVHQTVFDPADGYKHWVYIGVVGPIMTLALTSLFTALAAARRADPEHYGRIRLHFVGTDYAPAGRERKTVEPIAVACGVADLVEERPLRIPYAEGLQAMLDADALVMPGSDDPGYTASKLYPTILARKPLLAIFHEQSSVVNVMRETQAGTVVSFTSGENPEIVAARVYDAWFREQTLPLPQTDWDAFAPYTAREMTRQQCRVFDRAVADTP